MTTVEVAKKKKATLFSLRRLPQVIEMYVGKRERGSESPAYYAGHLDYWLRQCAIPGKLLSCYSNGALLSRKDAELIKFSVRKIWGNFAFLYSKANRRKAQKVAKALARASKIFWKGNKNHTMLVVEEPENYRPLHECLLGLLNSSRWDNRDKEEVEKLAEYFVIFCQSDKKILKELALDYYSATKERSEFSAYLPSED